MQGKEKLLKAIVFIIFLTIFSYFSSGSPVPFSEQQQEIEDIAEDISTPVKRLQVIQKLIAIVKDVDDIKSISSENITLEEQEKIHLKQFAADKLGNIKAIEAKDMLKSTAEILEWKDPVFDMKRSVTLSYWKIIVAEEPNNFNKEELLIKLLFDENHEPPHADVVASWAADELAGMGVKRALPEIIRSLTSNSGTSQYAMDTIKLCILKIDLLSNNENRLDVLVEALQVEDPTKYQRLKSWAIEGLSEINNEKSKEALINYALELQNKYYDENGEFIGNQDDKLASEAGTFYNKIIKILQDGDMTETEINATGLKPGKFFLMV